MAFQAETSLIPFWAEGKDFVNGRDPLGIQNSSVSIYASLFPGLNNVTDRLRYYGFYCWLLKSIEDKKLPFDTARDQYNYIRKAEYLIAVYMSEYEPDEQGVAGSAYAIRKIKEAKENGNKIIDIKGGAEKHKGTSKGSVYWDFNAGVLGQYYAGSLQNNYSGLGLISISERYYFPTNAGRKLGSAYGNTISKKASTLFFNIIDTGIMNLKEAKRLSDFSISNIRPDSDEGKFYRDMFFSEDFSLRENNNGQTKFRKDSLVMFLEYLKQCRQERDYTSFPNYIYQHKGFIGTKEECPASIGWFYYYTCERMHVSLENIFYSILLQIEELPILVNDTLEKLTKKCMKSFANYYSEFTPELPLLSVIKMLEEEDINYNETMKSYQKISSGDALVYALEYFLTTYKFTTRYKTFFTEFSNATQTREKNGTALDWIAFIEKHRATSVKDFFSQLLLKIINDHLFVAYSKMGSGDQQVHKFLLEDNYLIHINNIEPRFTTPRLRSARNFLQDMKILQYEDGTGYIISSY